MTTRVENHVVGVACVDVRETIRSGSCTDLQHSHPP